MLKSECLPINIDSNVIETDLIHVSRETQFSLIESQTAPFFLSILSISGLSCSEKKLMAKSLHESPPKQCA